MQLNQTAPLKAGLTHIARVLLHLEQIASAGEAPDGVRIQFMMEGTLHGPKLRGVFAGTTAAYLRVDRDGVGTIQVRAPLKLHDGGVAEFEATGRHDFGEDGYRRAVAGDLPDADLGWCPRLLTGDPRYLWLNRTQFLGVGRLRPKERCVDYDLFSMDPCVPDAPLHGS